MQSARGVHQDDVRPSGFCGGHGVVDDCGGIRTLAVADHSYSGALAPHFQLLARGGAEGVRGGDDDAPALFAEHVRQLAYRRGLAHPVDAGKQNDERIGILLGVVVDVVDEDLLQHVLGVVGRLDLLLEHAVLEVLHDAFRRGHAYVAGKQSLFERLVELVVESARRECVKQLFGYVVLGLFDALGDLFEKSHNISYLFSAACF